MSLVSVQFNLVRGPHLILFTANVSIASQGLPFPIPQPLEGRICENQ